MTTVAAFHSIRDSEELSGAAALVRLEQQTQRSLGYDFSLHQHPYVTELLGRLLEKSVRGLQDADTEPRPAFYDSTFFDAYAPTSSVATRPVKELDFGISGAYAPYNWELFFHVPLTIAIHLSKNGRYEDAQRWFHYVFDPTDDSDGPTPERFWKVRPFRTTDIELIQDILLNLATRKNETLARDTEKAIGDWSAAPFRPHLIARHRPSAYMFKTVMAYLDNLIAWGDSLYLQDTRESINEATQLYVLAALILGPRPQEVPRQATPRPQTYAKLRADLDMFGNAAREVETDIPFELMSFPPGGTGQPVPGIRTLGISLYFGVPRNDRLLGYWDTVADRLFKIRNSLNVRGVFRQLPLFEPPIDPALLARATSAGVDVAAVVAGVNQPLPLVRFSFLVQKASEMCQEVKALGASLLSAMEKKDAEALQILRAQHERSVLEAAEAVRYAQVQEAIKNREALQRSLATAIARYTYYERLLGREQESITADLLDQLDPLDTEGLEKGRFTSTEPEAKPRPRELTFDVVPVTPGLLETLHTLNSYEVAELSGITLGNNLLIAAGIHQSLAALASLLGQFSTNIMPWGIGVGVSVGGSEIAGSLSHVASVIQTASARVTTQAGIVGKAGMYARRQQEWEFQSNNAAGEISQLHKQLRASQIREAMVQRELSNHQQQIRNAKEIETFLHDERTGKTTNEAFYTWMRREVMGLHGRCCDLAFEVARKAERALQHELGDPELRYLEPGYMTGKDGLLAGEKLYLDVRRMEMAYHDLNRREYELTKHVSLLQLDPRALLQLRTAGTCTFSLPEELFDLGTSGQYFRRIKSVALSVAGVTGPYTSVNARLTLLRSSIRRSPLLTNNEYARAGFEDDRFSDSFGSLDSIVTSTGQNDAGLFELNLRDERMLPFEGHGAISTWQLELPGEVRQFDYETIADVVLHVRYTAREDGMLKDKAVANLEQRFKEAATVGSVRLFSVRHEFPSEWAKLKATRLTGAATTATLQLELLEEHYPFWSAGRLHEVKAVDMYAKTKKSHVEASTEVTNAAGAKVRLTDPFDPAQDLPGVQKCALKKIPLPRPTGTFSVDLNDTTMEDLWIAVAWASKP
jgi:hypothetical protein